jgi:hypothetical protein
MNRLWLLGVGSLLIALGGWCFLSGSAKAGCGPKTTKTEADPTADGTAVDPNGMTVEQLLSCLAEIKAKEEELAKKKQSVVDVLKKKLQKQRERLKELGVTDDHVVPPPPPTYGSQAVPSLAPSAPPPPPN